MRIGPAFYATLAEQIRDGLDSSSAMAALREMWWARYSELTPLGIEQHLEHGSASYVFDRAGDLPGAPQPDRTVAAYGFAEKPDALREKGYQARFPLGRRFEHDVDRGHLMPHSGGGLYGPNLFPQSSVLNQGRSRAGRVYRATESRAAERELFFFCALIYGDDTDMPVYIELGVVENRVLDVVLFRNRFDHDATRAFPPSTDEWLDSLTVAEYGTLGEEVARAHLEEELGAIIVALGDAGMERGLHGEQDLDIVAILDGELTAVEVKTRYLGRLAGVLTRAGNLRRPRLLRPAAPGGQGSPGYALRRLDKYLAELDGIPRVVVALVDLRLRLIQLFEVEDGRVRPPSAAPEDCSAALEKALAELGYA